MIGNNNENNNKNNNNNDRTTIINATTEFNSSRLSKSYLNTVRYPYSKTLGLVLKSKLLMKTWKNHQNRKYLIAQDINFQIRVDFPCSLKKS